jgi:ABC-2 type transport system ATP-binding protein
MNHLVVLDSRAGELEKILSGVKRMLVRDYDPHEADAEPVSPGDCLYFLRDAEDRTVRVRAIVARALLLTGTTDEELSHALKEMQPRLQLTEEQYNRWSARRQVLLVEFEAAHKAALIDVAPCRIRNSPGWVAFRELREITEEEVAHEDRAFLARPKEEHSDARCIRNPNSGREGRWPGEAWGHILKGAWKMNPSNPLMIETCSLSKAYNGVQALTDFSLKLTPGILGLLGPNGAGKSTLMRMLATITKPTAGTILWNGGDVVKDPEALRSVLGYLPQDFGVYPNLSAQEFLEYMGAIKGMSGEKARRKISDLLDMVNLREAARRPLGGYSGGMRQRVGIAQALLNDPELLIVDEPTVGLDPEERVRFRNLLSDLSGERIVILSTHIVSDVESTATDLAIIHKGHLKVHARPEQLLKQMEGSVWEWTATSEELVSLKKQFLVSGTLRRMEGVEVRVVSQAKPCAQARPMTPTLEDAYLATVAQRNGGAA